MANFTLNVVNKESPRVLTLDTLVSDWCWSEGPDLVPLNGDFQAFTGGVLDDWTITEVGDATSQAVEHANGVQMDSDGSARLSLNQPIAGLKMQSTYKITLNINTDTAGLCRAHLNGPLGLVADVTGQGNTLSLADAGNTVGWVTPAAEGTGTGAVLEADDVNTDQIYDGFAVQELGVWNPDGIRIYSIDFVGATDNDTIILRDGAINGPIFYYKQVTANYDQGAQYFPNRLYRPYLDLSECTYTSGTIVITLR